MIKLIAAVVFAAVVCKTANARSPYFDLRDQPWLDSAGVKAKYKIYVWHFKQMSIRKRFFDEFCYWFLVGIFVKHHDKLL